MEVDGATGCVCLFAVAPAAPPGIGARRHGGDGASRFGSGTNQIPLPTVQVQAGDTLTATLVSESVNATDIDCQMACAFIPTNKRISTPEPNGPSVYLSSVIDEVAADGDISVTTTVDESGILSLGSLQVRGYCDLAAAGAEPVSSLQQPALRPDERVGRVRF